MQVKKVLLKADLREAMKNLVQLHKTKTRTLPQSETVDAHCKAIIDFIRTKSFSLNHVADFLKAIYPSRAKMIEFVKFLRSKVENDEFRSVKTTHFTSEQIAVQITSCTVTRVTDDEEELAVTNGEEFLDWLVSATCL